MTSTLAAVAPIDDPHPHIDVGARSSALPVVAVGILAAMLMFHRLGDDGMHGDESQYALATRDVVDRGAWLAPSPYPPVMWFHKPPLYMWLSAALAPVTDDAPVRYRAWSAAFGVGAVVMTALLAARAFGPVVALFAGLVLLTNIDFLYHHGARQGTMDTALTFLTVAVAYVLTPRRATPATMTTDCEPTDRDPLESQTGAQRLLRGSTGAIARWVVAGILLGLMSLFKPLAGAPLLALLGAARYVDFVAFVGWKKDADGTSIGSGSLGKAIARGTLSLAVAGAVMLLVAAPWYVACAARYGHAFTGEMFGLNLVARIATGMGPENKPWDFYPRLILGGSPLFALAAVAIPYVLWRGVREPRARLVGVIAVGWPLLFSLSAGKAAQYVYPALPMVAICVAALLVHGARRLWPPETKPVVDRAVLTHSAILLVIGIVLQFMRHLSTDVRPYPPAAVYASVTSAVGRGEVTLAAIGFHSAQVDWRGRLGLEARDCFYLEPLVRRATVTSVFDYQTAVSRGAAVFAVVSKTATRPGDLAVTVAHEAPAFVLEQSGLDHLLPGRRVDAAPLRLPGERRSFADRFTLELQPTTDALIYESFVAIDVELNTGAPAAVWWSARRVDTGRKISGPSFLIPVAGGHQLFARFDPHDWQEPFPVNVEFRLRDNAEGRPINGTIRGARLLVNR